MASVVCCSVLRLDMNSSVPRRSTPGTVYLKRFSVEMPPPECCCGHLLPAWVLYFLATCHVLLEAVVLVVKEGVRRLKALLHSPVPILPVPKMLFMMKKEVLMEMEMDGKLE